MELTLPTPLNSKPTPQTLTHKNNGQKRNIIHPMQTTKYEY